MIRVAVFASGNGSNFENLVTANLKYAKICLLVIDKEDAYAKTRAEKLGIPWIFINPKGLSKAVFEEKILTHLKNYQIEFIALAGYMRFIGNTLLEAYPNLIINLHPAYLPNFPGATSITDAFNAKVAYSGVTIHYVDKGIDTGEIIHQEKVQILKSMTLDDFEKSIHTLEYIMYPKILDKICKEKINEKSIN
ncbi:MAG: phosphoribosylglycinamide formyltransferase [Anaerorhabdus sp.]